MTTTRRPKHTPAPWHVTEREFGHCIFPSDAHNPLRLEAGGSSIGAVAIVKGMDGRGGEGTDAANARLVAAAPSLLAAARLALETLNCLTTERFAVGDDRPARDALTAAIAKATGEFEPPQEETKS